MYFEPTNERLELIFSILDKYGMRDNVIWGASTYNYVYTVKNYYSKANIYTRSSTYSDVTSMLNGLKNLTTGVNHVIVAVRLESMEEYAPILRKNGYDVIYITPTKEEFISVYSYVTAVMSEDYVASEYLIEYLLGGNTSDGGSMGGDNTGDSGDDNTGGDNTGGDSGETEPYTFNLNRTQGTDWYSDENYLNPVDQTTLHVLDETPCGITNLTENSITVTENGKGGRGVVFPIKLEYGKPYTLTWNATGTTDTRFRIMVVGGSLKTIDLDNKNGTVTFATMNISEDGKTINVNGTEYTFTGEITITALHFSAATGKTVNYTGVTLTEG